MATPKKQKSAGKTPKPTRKRTVKAPFRWTSGFWQRHWPALLILAVMSALPYLQTLDYGYVLDDQIVITGNQFTQKGLDGIEEIYRTESIPNFVIRLMLLDFPGIGDILRTESMTGYFGEQKDLVAGARYRPLSIVTFAIEHEISPNNPMIGHAGNILFYVLCCLLLYRVLLLWFPLSSHQFWWWSVPFAATLFYALHPVHTEVVANIKGRDEIMTFMGALGAIWFSMRWLADQKPVWLALSGVSFFLGLLSKENAITFLAVIPAGMYWFTQARGKDYGRVMVPIVAAAVIYLIIRYNVIGYFLSSGKEITDLMNNPFVGMQPDQKLATILYTLGLYLKLLIFPLQLSHDYYPYAIPIMNWTDWRVWLSLLSYGGLIGILFWGYQKKTVPAFAVFFYLATLSIVSNIVFPVGTFMNERFIFISSAAFALAVAWILVERMPLWLGNKRGVAVGLVVASLIVGGYFARTYTRVPVWENAMTLNRAAIEVSPNSARVNTFLTTAIYKEYQTETDETRRKEMLEEMGFHIRKSLDIYPNYYSGFQMFVGVLAEEYRYDNDLDKLLAGFKRVFLQRDHLEFIDTYLNYLEGLPNNHPKLVEFYYDIGYNVFWRQKRKKAYAIKFLEKGLALSPGNSTIQQALIEVRQS